MKLGGNDTGRAQSTNQTSGLIDSQEVRSGDMHAGFNSGKNHNEETIFSEYWHTCSDEWKKWKFGRLCGIYLIETTD